MRNRAETLLHLLLVLIVHLEHLLLVLIVHLEHLLLVLIVHLEHEIHQTGMVTMFINMV